jgi:hypothetical protein
MSQPPCKGGDVARPDIKQGQVEAQCKICGTLQKVDWELQVAKLVRHPYPEKNTLKPKVSYASPSSRSKKKRTHRENRRRFSGR